MTREIDQDLVDIGLDLKKIKEEKNLGDLVKKSKWPDKIRSKTWLQFINYFLIRNNMVLFCKKLRSQDNLIIWSKTRDKLGLKTIW